VTLCAFCQMVKHALGDNATDCTLVSACRRSCPWLIVCLLCMRSLLRASHGPALPNCAFHLRVVTHKSVEPDEEFCGVPPARFVCGAPCHKSYAEAPHAVWHMLPAPVLTQATYTGNGSGLLKLSGIGDPSGRGEGFSYLKHQMLRTRQPNVRENHARTVLLMQHSTSVHVVHSPLVCCVGACVGCRTEKQKT